MINVNILMTEKLKVAEIFVESSVQPERDSYSTENISLTHIKGLSLVG